MWQEGKVRSDSGVSGGEQRQGGGGIGVEDRRVRGPRVGLRRCEKGGRRG